MQAHQERVVIEKKELDEKLEKLLAFIGAGSGPVFSKLVTEEQERLTTQARIMKEYSDILADRINALFFAEVDLAITLDRARSWSSL